ncbi:unnamed protein product [Withania somnifera]
MSTKSTKTGAILMQKYKIGKLLGQGTFAKVYHARNLKTGQNVMRLIRHPNVVELYEVMARRTKIYFAMKYVRGGELFYKVAKGRLRESPAQKCFQQLIAIVDFCHNKTASYTRTCGTLAYVAPEVINKRGYDDEKADIWSCGVILFVFLAGYLPFHDANLMEMYKKISKGDCICPEYFPFELMSNTWLKKGFKQIDKTPIFDKEPEESPRSVFDVVDDLDAECSSGHKEQSSSTMKPTCLNALDIISLSPGFDLSSLFTTQNSASTIVSRLEKVASMGSFKKKDKTVKMQGSKEGRKGQLAIDAEIFEITPAFHVVEVTKKSGDTTEYGRFCDQGLRPSSKDIVWTWRGNEQQVENQEIKTLR